MCSSDLQDKLKSRYGSDSLFYGELKSLDRGMIVVRDFQLQLVPKWVHFQHSYGKFASAIVSGDRYRTNGASVTVQIYGWCERTFWGATLGYLPAR